MPGHHVACRGRPPQGPWGGRMARVAAGPALLETALRSVIGQHLHAPRAPLQPMRQRAAVQCRPAGRAPRPTLEGPPPGSLGSRRRPTPPPPSALAAPAHRSAGRRCYGCRRPRSWGAGPAGSHRPTSFRWQARAVAAVEASRWMVTQAAEDYFGPQGPLTVSLSRFRPGDRSLGCCRSDAGLGCRESWLAAVHGSTGWTLMAGAGGRMAGWPARRSVLVDEQLTRPLTSLWLQPACGIHLRWLVLA